MSLILAVGCQPEPASTDGGADVEEPSAEADPSTEGDRGDEPDGSPPTDDGPATRNDSLFGEEPSGDGPSGLVPARSHT